MRTRALSLVFALTCLAASVPKTVATRPLTTGADPTGTWTLEGVGKPLVVAAPADKGQLYDITFDGVSGMGKGLSDGEWLYVVYPVLPGERIGLGVFERGPEGVEGILGLYKLGWEAWIPKEPGEGFSGVYQAKGVTGGGSKFAIGLGVRPAAPGTDAYELVWQGDTNRFEAAGLANDGKLVVARWGVTVTTTDLGAGADGSLWLTKTTENRERPHLFVGAYKIGADRLEGRQLEVDTNTITPQAFTR